MSQEEQKLLLKLKNTQELEIQAIEELRKAMGMQKSASVERLRL